MSFFRWVAFATVAAAVGATSAGCVFDLAPLDTSSGGGSGGAVVGGSGGIGAGGAPGSATYELAISYQSGEFADVLERLPMLVVLTPDRIDYSLVAADGSDLRFYDSDGTLLAHEIERWNPTGQSEVWVLLPQVTPDASSFVMRFGGASDQALAPTLVWEDYSAVYHLADTSPDTAVVDSAGTHNGTGVDTTSDAGFVGAGVRFNGVTSEVAMGTAPGWDPATGGVLTISVWFQRDIDPGETFMSGRTMTPIGTLLNDCQGWSMLIFGDEFANQRLTTFMNACSYQPAATSSSGLPGQYSDENWHRLTGVIDRAAGEVRLYRDGAADPVAVEPADLTNDLTSSAAFLGKAELGGANRFDGMIDEVRLRPGLTSDAWRAATFAIARDEVLDFGNVVEIGL